MIPSAPPVLTEAVVLKRIKVGERPCIRKIPDLGSPDGIMEVEDVEDVHAEPGDRIDVSTWSNVDAYVRQGIIHLVTPDIEVLVNRPEKTTGTGVKPRARSNS